MAHGLTPREYAIASPDVAAVMGLDAQKHGLLMYEREDGRRVTLLADPDSEVGRRVLGTYDPTSEVARFFALNHSPEHFQPSGCARKGRGHGARVAVLSHLDLRLPRAGGARPRPTLATVAPTMCRRLER